MLLGAIVALASPRGAALRPATVRMRRLRRRWAPHWSRPDIVRSNFTVARIVLGGCAQRHPPGSSIPLELRDPHGLAALAIIITSSPGTVWAER